jgi:hypothetical protein
MLAPHLKRKEENKKGPCDLLNEGGILAPNLKSNFGNVIYTFGSTF